MSSLTDGSLLDGFPSYSLYLLFMDVIDVLLERYPDPGTGPEITRCLTSNWQNTQNFLVLAGLQLGKSGGMREFLGLHSKLSPRHHTNITKTVSSPTQTD